MRVERWPATPENRSQGEPDGIAGASKEIIRGRHLDPAPLGLRRLALRDMSPS
jgi:hypothetical protein